MSNSNLAKSVFLSNFDISTDAAFLNQILLHNYINLIQNLFCLYYEYMVLGITFD